MNLTFNKRENIGKLAIKAFFIGFFTQALSSIMFTGIIWGCWLLIVKFGGSNFISMWFQEHPLNGWGGAITIWAISFIIGSIYSNIRKS